MCFIVESWGTYHDEMSTESETERDGITRACVSLMPLSHTVLRIYRSALLPHVLTFSDQQGHAIAHTPNQNISTYCIHSHADAEQHHPCVRRLTAKNSSATCSTYRVHNPATCRASYLIPALLLTFSKVPDTSSDHRMASLNDSNYNDYCG